MRRAKEFDMIFSRIAGGDSKIHLVNTDSEQQEKLVDRVCFGSQQNPFQKLEKEQVQQ
jgi:hypothetical protein